MKAKDSPPHIMPAIMYCNVPMMYGRNRCRLLGFRSENITNFSARFGSKRLGMSAGISFDLLFHQK